MAGVNKKKEKPIPKIDLSDDYFGAVLNCAVRYCLGRATYMPGLVIAFIRPLIPYLSPKTIWCMERDIEEAEHYGMESDKNMWLRFLADIKVMKKEEKK